MDVRAVSSSLCSVATMTSCLETADTSSPASVNSDETDKDGGSFLFLVIHDRLRMRANNLPRALPAILDRLLLVDALEQPSAEDATMHRPLPFTLWLAHAPLPFFFSTHFDPGT